jgi:hypothetical protein
MIKGYIFMPAQCKNYSTDRYLKFFEMFKEKDGFELGYSNSPQVPPDADVVIAHSGPQHSWPDSMMNLVHLPKRTKLIAYMGDPWSHGNKILEANMPRMLERADAILSCTEYCFNHFWGKFKGKMVWFPNFFAPFERFDLPIRNIKDINTERLLITGSTFESFYPIRASALKTVPMGKIRVIQHPGFHPNLDKAEKEGHYVRDKYAEVLNSYFVSLCCSTVWKCMVAKYVEIAAAGSLVLADDCPDVRKAGLQANVHFVPITKDNMLGMLNDVLAHPQKYDAIRHNGREYARAHHSERSRYTQLRGLIKSLTGK